MICAMTLTAYLKLTKPWAPIAIALMALLAFGGCASGGNNPVFSVAAAASLSVAFDEIGEAFTAQTGIPVRFSYASTGQLAQQIRNGAPFDLFAAADVSSVDRLIDEGLLEQDTRTLYAVGHLVLVVDPRSGLGISKLDDLVDPSVTRIAIANPEVAPYGLAARQMLQAAGIWQAVTPKVVYAENVRQAEQMVETGNAPVGIVAASVAQVTNLEQVDVPEALDQPVEHLAAVLRRSASKDTATRFLRFLRSTEALRILRAHNLEPPEGN